MNYEPAHIFQFSGDGAGRWFHFNIEVKEKNPGLTQIEELKISNAFKRALVARDSRPRFLKAEKGFLMTLRGINTNQDRRPEDMVSLRLWSNGTDLITVSRRPLKSMTNLIAESVRGSVPRDSFDFVRQILERLNAFILPTILSLEDTLFDYEEEYEEIGLGAYDNITALNHQLIAYKKYLDPQSLCVSSFIDAFRDKMLSKDISALLEASNILLIAVESLQEISQRTQVIRDDMSISLAEKMNRNTYTLSVVAAIFMPLSFLAGLFGANLGGIPGATEEQGFLIFSLILLVVVVIQVYIFKKNKWF